ncbi:INO80 complex subunit 4 [Cytospora mali]|uniref:INO80 complex subunit 4 n=1 Tax=Cytospora mali TaxID=578113 RepID=A0A194V3J2_CYTMA|nr:INO80 complex subunit 4 [Valsa mali var. pyri (nom. inval.)]
MAPSSKTAGSAKDRRKSSSAASRLITLKVSPDRLRTLLDPASETPKEDTPMKDAKDSPSDSTSLLAATATNPENASDSNPATPANGSTPVPSVMGPPGEGQGPKKKGVKRSAAAANGDGASKIRGKPGPKKRQRMDDGTLEPRPAAHRLGPKANQGAINAGLRALDRSGKPCRKWTKGGFQLKTFTGVHWEIPRWTAPPKPKPVEVTTEEGVTTSGPVSADGSSSKENKENVVQPIKSDTHSNSNSGGDVEMQSAPSIQASSPAPMPIAAGA